MRPPLIGSPHPPSLCHLPPSLPDRLVLVPILPPFFSSPCFSTRTGPLEVYITGRPSFHQRWIILSDKNTVPPARRIYVTRGKPGNWQKRGEVAPTRGQESLEELSPEEAFK